jgi:hypothetical protein
MPVLLYIPDAFLLPETSLRTWRTSSVRGRTFVLVLACPEMPAMTAFPLREYPRPED